MACRKFHQEQPVHQRFTPGRHASVHGAQQYQASIGWAYASVYIGYF
jgi:hypothetical protein